MGWWRRVNDVLKKEPETWLAYLYGQRFHDLKHLQDKEPRYKGAHLRLLIYIYTLLRLARFRFSPRVEHATFLVYVGTRNQKSALETTIESLRRKGQSIVVVSPQAILSQYEVDDRRYSVMALGPLEIFKALLLLSSRLAAVMRMVRSIDSRLFSKQLDTFLRPHVDLIYFDRLLEEIEPKYVVVSNDHNRPNRSLLALARRKGCKTVYMQHASVSTVFPAINVDYAFLDGISAYETYLQCEGNRPITDSLLRNRKVILSGQKKALNHKKGKLQTNVVGLAVNALDKVENIDAFVKQLSEQNIKLKVRWHPGLGKKAVDTLLASLRQWHIQLSDPHQEGLSDFLSSVDALIAGNSSIHLESALCGTPTFYFEITATDKPDYYGYVKHGVAVSASSSQEIVSLLRDAVSGNIQVKAGAVRRYSDTYETEWEGREGELVANVLIALDAEKALPMEIQTLSLD